METKQDGGSRQRKARRSPGRQRPFYLIWQAGLAFQSAVNEFGKRDGIALKKYMALLYISRSQGMTASQLSRRLETTPQSANELVGSLEGNGLIRKEQSDADRRVLILSLTDDGRRYLADAERAIEQAENFLLRGLSPELLDELWPTLLLVIERGRAIDARS